MRELSGLLRPTLLHDLGHCRLPVPTFAPVCGVVSTITSELYGQSIRYVCTLLAYLSHRLMPHCVWMKPRCGETIDLKSGKRIHVPSGTTPAVISYQLNYRGTYHNNGSLHRSRETDAY